MGHDFCSYIHRYKVLLSSFLQTTNIYHMANFFPIQILLLLLPGIHLQFFNQVRTTNISNINEELSEIIRQVSAKPSKLQEKSNIKQISVPQFTLNSNNKIKREATTNDESKSSRNNENKTNTLIDEITAYIRESIHQWREDADQRYTPPIWPTIRETFRNYFAPSKSEVINPPIISEENGQRRFSKQQTSFWSLLLDKGTKNSKSENERKDLGQKIKDILNSERFSEHEQPLRQLKLAAATSLIPICALGTQNRIFCLHDSDYPTDLVRESIQQDESEVACNLTLGRFFIHRLNTAKVGACNSPIHKIRPLRAKNHDGIWKLLVNVNTCQQTLYIQRCQPSCATSKTNSMVRRHCKEVHAPYTLFAFDSKQGFHQDQFNFPSACWCT